MRCEGRTKNRGTHTDTVDINSQNETIEIARPHNSLISMFRVDKLECKDGMSAQRISLGEIEPVTGNDVRDCTIFH